MKNRRTVNGFTLIELLVVISIIAILAAMLMPVLRKARDSARSATCLSQLREHGNAHHTYCSNNDGFFVETFDWQRDTGHGIIGKTWTRVFCESNVFGIDDIRDAYGYNGPDACGVYLCPSDRRAEYMTTTFNNSRGVSYYLNAQIADCPENYQGGGIPHNLRWYHYLRRSEVETPGRTMLAIDGLAGTYDNVHSGRNYYIVATTFEMYSSVDYRHNGRTQTGVLFVDGHAELVDQPVPGARIHVDYPSKNVFWGIDWNLADSLYHGHF